MKWPHRISPSEEAGRCKARKVKLRESRFGNPTLLRPIFKNLNAESQTGEGAGSLNRM